MATRQPVKSEDQSTLRLELVAKYRIPIRYLHLEITESAYTDNPRQIIEVVEKMRNLGFVIEMDDFGSGYSSLNMLAEMPVDVLKLDMKFVQNEAKKSSGKGILSFVISLAKWLDLAVVAEGVETAEQISSLRSMDCNYVQGFYFAKPMKLEDFENLLQTAKTTEMVCTSRTAVQYIVDDMPKHEAADGKVMLIVDDIEINRAALAANFMDSYAIVEKENGKMAWEYLDEHYDQVNIIMLDLLMPVMDGFQLLNKIRSDERMKNLPVIITSQGDSDSEKRALEMRANDFISKPYNTEIIRHRVENVVAGYELHCIKKHELELSDLMENEKGSQESPSPDEKIKNNVEVLKPYFDVVRLVDPVHTLVYENDKDEKCDIHSCYAIWGKTTRCNHCTSLKAYEQKSKFTKLEYSEDGLYFVISEYVPYGSAGAVIELVTKLDDEYVDNVFDKDLLYMNLDELNLQLEYDELTGVYNRRHISLHQDKYISRARKYDRNLGIAMVDVDYFKAMNDTYGHLAGDEILKTVAKMLENNIALSKGDFVSRFGGDEFIIVCRDIQPDIFVKRVQAVSDLIHHMIMGEGIRVEVGISAGCVSASEFPDLDANGLIEQADKRMYRAKEAGKGRVVYTD
ncbi:MAG: diguanylate cyclase [Lachnospiraceae bacterium]|nr:diguanylate cyclase [Lachnospiraceae bacterium]